MIFPYGAIISCEAVKAPVLGLKLSLVEVTFAGKFPVLAVTQTG
jgi:hypothetical protein